MATFTPLLNLRKPDPTDLINVATDLNANYDIIDTLSAGGGSGGFGFPCSVDLASLNQANLIVGANVGVYMRCRDGGTISKVTMQFMNSVGFISVAAYANSLAGRLSVPGTRLATSGAIACPAIGVRDIALGASIAFPAGGWLGFSCSDGTLQVLSNTGNVFAITQPMLNGVQLKQAAAHPLPATPTPVSTGGMNIILIGTT